MIYKKISKLGDAQEKLLTEKKEKETELENYLML